MNLSVEYIVVIESQKKFCATVKDLYNYLSIQEGIRYRNNCIEYRGLVVPITVISGQTENKQERFFQITFRFKNENKDLNTFLDFLREIRELLHNLGKLFVLQDDVSLYYGNQAYPIIHETENLMRKLINSFMLKKLGSNWGDSAFPQQLNTATNKEREGTILHKLDFDDLRVFLFKEYSTKSHEYLFKVIKDSKKLSDLSLDELKDLIPKSNWERYFSKIVDCDDKYLVKRWEQLYQLRNQVAHNAIIGKSQYENIKSLASEIRVKLEVALEHIDKIQIPKAERQLLMSQLGTAIDDIYQQKIVISLLDRNNEVPVRSALNWGQREGRNPNQAYLYVPADIQNSGFFPSPNRVFTVITDDNKTFSCVRTQDNGRAMQTVDDENIWSEYFRNRLGIESGKLVTKSDLARYGRFDITFRKLGDDIFLMDFSKAESNTD